MIIPILFYCGNIIRESRNVGLYLLFVHQNDPSFMKTMEKRIEK